MIVLAVISFTAIPALRSVARAQGASDREAIETLTTLARQRAWATGRPHALRVEAGGDEASVVWIATGGGAQEAVPSVTGGAGARHGLREDALLDVSVVEAPPEGGFEVWFNASGTPLSEQPPDEDGSPVSEPIILTFESGAVLSVAPLSGMLTW